MRKGKEMDRESVNKVLDKIYDYSKLVVDYDGVLYMAASMINELYAKVDALEIDNSVLSKGNAQLMQECIRLKKQNDKFREVLTSELNAVYEVRESRWGARQLDPVVAIKCTKHEAIAICQQLNATGKGDYFYIIRSEVRK